MNKEKIIMTGTLKDGGGPMLTDAMTPEIDEKIKTACADGSLPDEIKNAVCESRGI